MLSILLLSNQIKENQNPLEKNDMQHVMGTNNHEEIFDFCKNNRVDIILIDTETIVNSPFIELADRIRKECPDTKFVYITSDSNNTINKVTIAKSDSLLNRGISYNELVSSLCFIENNYRIFPLSNVIKIKNYEKLNDLTPREMEVLDGLCRAYSRDEICQFLTISENTLKTHIQNILNKTGYNNVLKLALDLVIKGELTGER